MNNWDKLDDFHENLSMPCLLLFLIGLLILIKCTLCYSKLAANASLDSAEDLLCNNGQLKLNELTADG
ncbi:hypothetical protein TNCV_4498641 [Trichonephila clavipes]|nr:hypothetical protein TNCV_4498641 [Trichonephila clavipes]